MQAKKPAFRQVPRAFLTASVPAPDAERIDAVAHSLGISRNRLLILAIDAGLPAVVAAHTTKQQS